MNKIKLISVSEQGRLGIWALDGDPNHTGLLKYALTEQNFEHTLVMLVASMAQPWSILDSLENWVTVLRQHIDRLKLLPEDRRDYEQSCKYTLLVSIFRSYTYYTYMVLNTGQPHFNAVFGVHRYGLCYK